MTKTLSIVAIVLGVFTICYEPIALYLELTGREPTMQVPVPLLVGGRVLMAVVGAMFIVGGVRLRRYLHPTVSSPSSLKKP